MSDYPRPKESSVSGRYRWDRVLALLYGLLIYGGAIAWIADLARAWNGRGPEFWEWFKFWRWQFVAYGAVAILYGFGFIGMLKSRKYGFVTIALLTIFLLIGATMAKKVSSLAVFFPLWAFCVARIFGILGPKL